MKLMIFAVVLLLMLVGGVFFNSRYVTGSINRLIDDARGLPATEPPPLPESEALYESWKRAERYFNLSVGHRDLMEIEAQFATMLGACKADDRVEFLIAREQLVYALLHLRDMTDYGFDDIF